MMEANRSGASAYITKPFRSDHLLQTIARRAARRERVPRRHHRACRRWPTCRSRCSGCCSTTASSASSTSPSDGVQALEQLQGFEVVDDVYRVVGQGLRARARRADPRRGLHLHLQPGRRLPHRPVAARATRGVHQPRRTCWSSSSASRRTCSSGSRQELESRLLAKVDLFVGSSRLTQSPKIRFKRALLDAIARATQSIEAERDEIRAPPARGVRAGHRRRSRLTCVFQPIVNLKDFAAIGYELLSRGPRESELHRPDALFEIARSEGRVAELDRLCRRTASRAGEDPAARAACASSTPSR